MSRVKGWCPSAHRPMMSGDGLLVRVKPRLGRLSAAQGHTLCALSERLGNGIIDVTSRANLQIRGVREDDHSALLEALIASELVAADPIREARRALVVTPHWQNGDLTHRLGQALDTADLPDLPDKMGIALDTGPARMLQGVSGDFRFETTGTGDLILRAEGAAKGRLIDEVSAVEALRDLMGWFLQSGGAEAGRMARHLKQVALPDTWQQAEPGRSVERPLPGAAIGGLFFGIPFGQTEASALATLLRKTAATHMRVTPWRMVFLENAAQVDQPGFLSRNDPILDVAACPGKPACAAASVDTRDLARQLGVRATGTLHVSGCAKGCARQSPAAITLVGHAGRFDLVRNGCAGDTPDQSGLSETEVMELLG